MYIKNVSSLKSIKFLLVIALPLRDTILIPVIFFKMATLLKKKKLAALNAHLNKHCIIGQFGVRKKYHERALWINRALRGKYGDMC